MKPSIGRIVHYTNLGDRDGKFPPEVQAALITKVNADGTVALHVFYPTGQFDMPSVAKTDAVAGSEEARGKWAWPAREAEVKPVAEVPRPVIDVFAQNYKLEADVARLKRDLADAIQQKNILASELQLIINASHTTASPVDRVDMMRTLAKQALKNLGNN